MFSVKKNLDMDLTLDKTGAAKMSYVEKESGEYYGFGFRFTGDLDEGRKEQALCIGYDILSWFDTMKERLNEKEG